MLESLYEQYSRDLYAFARRQGATHEDAEDIVQAVFLSALKGYEDRGYPKAWLYRVAYSRLIDLRRKMVRHPEAAEVEQPFEIEDSIVARLDCTAQIKRLTPQQRKAMVLHHWYGLSLVETAARMGCAPGTVKSLCYRARAT